MPDNEIKGGRSQVRVDVWNRALDRIGQTEMIEDEGEPRLAAAVCRRHYDDCLEECLERKPFPWAGKQCRPNRLVATARVGWAYTYALPPDFVAPRCIISGGLRFSLTPGEAKIPYELQDNDKDDGQVLCTDYLFQGDDALEYTTRNVVVAAWPRLFVSALSFRLAFELALAIPKDLAKAREMYGAYEAELSKAFATSVKQQVPDQPLEAENIRARRS